MKTKQYIVLLLATAVPTAATAQHADSVRWEHEKKLGEIVVTGLTGTAALKNTPVPMAVMTHDELTRTTATNIIDAVASQPGMAQITTGGGISKPVIRGLGYNRVVVVNDGIRQEGQQWGDEHGVEIDAQAVGSVEILKGPSSLIYGSDAMAGVLLMHSMPLPALGTLQASATSEYQTNNGLFAYSVNASGNSGGFVWNSRWSQKLAHAYKDGDGTAVYGSQFRERAFTQMLGLNKRWGYSHLTLSYYHLTPSLAEGDTDGAYHAYSPSEPYQQINHYKAVADNTIFIGEGNVKFLVGYQQNQRQEYEEAEECGLDFRLHTVNYDVRYSSPTINDEWKLTAGTSGMYQRSLNEGTEYLVPAYRLFDCGIFATSSRDHGQWHLSGGLRYDRRHLTSFALTDDGEQRFSRFSRRFNGLSASIGAVWNASDRLNLRLNIARGFRAPNISELGSNGEHEGTGRYEIGNHNLKAESSWQADFGIDFSLPWLYVQLSLFANHISNYVFLERSDGYTDGLAVLRSNGYTEGQTDASMVIPHNRTTENHTTENTYLFTSGNARLLGGELMIDIHPIDFVHFENTFSYVDAIQLGKYGGERYLPFTPAPRLTSTLRFTASRRHATFVSVGLEHDLAQNHVHTANATETTTPAYTLFNASAGTDIFVRGHSIATLTLTVSNIANRTYQNHLSRLKYVTPEGINNMGRNIGVKITIPLEMNL